MKPIEVVYLDESGIEHDMKPTRGRAKRGKSVIAIQAGKRDKRLNIIAGLCQNKVIVPDYYDWSTTSQWFEWHLCPHLPPNSVIVMDNASFHRKSEVNRIAKAYGHLVWWLPPYWANMKHWLRRQAHLFNNIQAAVSFFFKLK